MKRNTWILVLFCALIGCVTQKKGTGAGAYDPVNPESVVYSPSGSTDSHAAGQSCLNCHRQGGGSEIWLSLAGTLYQSDGVTPQPEGRIELYTKPRGRGRLLRTIAADANGNFFTTAAIDFSDSLYLTAAGADGAVRHKLVALTDGNCNHCHGREAERISLD